MFKKSNKYYMYQYIYICEKAAYMYISTSTHCPYPFHEKEHSGNLIFTYCAGEISSVIEIKSY